MQEVRGLGALHVSCNVADRCYGWAVASAMYDTWFGGEDGPCFLCEWHVHRVLTTPSAGAGFRHLRFEQLDDGRPWLPPGSADVTEVYRELGHGPYDPSLLPHVDWAAWQPSEPLHYRVSPGPSPRQLAAADRARPGRPPALTTDRLVSATLMAMLLAGVVLAAIRNL